MDGKILKPESLRLMTSPVTLNDGRIRDYGCGLSLRREDGLAVFAHGGAISGFRASNTLVPGIKAAVVVLINDEQSDPGIGQAILKLLTRRELPSDVPKVAGPPAKEAALAFFHQMQEGKLDRSTLGEEFSVYLDDENVRAAAPALKKLGEPKSVEVANFRERGGLEVSTVRLKFADLTLEGLMYRSTDGKVQQLLFGKGD